MTHAPHVTNTTLSRRRCHLRTHHDALLQLSARQKWMTPTKYRAYRQNACKPALGPNLTGLVQRVCQIGSDASPPPKSP
jgi:hypothetical protein